MNDADLRARALERLQARTGLAGSLGRMEHLALQLAQTRQQLPPQLAAPQALVLAADHGIAGRGVSSLPPDGTRLAATALLQGRSSLHGLCALQGVAITLVNCGIRGPAIDPGPDPAVRWVDARIAGMPHGSEDCTRQLAMAPAARTQAIENGQQLVRELPGNVLLLGTLGVGSTASAALLMALLTGQPVEQCAGRGVGLDNAGMARKVTVLRMALQRHARAVEPLAALASVGGLETATSVGAVLQAAHEGRILVVDGLGATAAVAIAARLSPAVLQRCVFSHRSADPAHGRWLERLGAQPLLDLGIQLGSGDGAVLAWPLLRAAAALLDAPADPASTGAPSLDPPADPAD